MLNIFTNLIFHNKHKKNRNEIICVQNKFEDALTPCYNKKSKNQNLLCYKELRHGSLSYHIWTGLNQQFSEFIILRSVRTYG